MIVVGGFGPTFWKEEVLRSEPAVDVVFLGDAEVSLPDFVRRLKQGTGWRQTPGILYRDGDAFRANPMARLPALDSLPHPRRDPRYPLHECTISASRGCAYRCTFCSITPFYQMQPGKHIRLRSPESLVEEMESLARDHEIQWINFTDDDFLGINRVQPGWSDRIADLMLSRGVRLKMFFQTRADHVSEPVMRKLKEAGLRTVAFGIESCAPRMLETLDKKVSREKNREAIRIMTELRINYELYSIFVDADSRLEELIENMDEFESMAYYDSNDPVPFSMQVNEFKAFPYPGTRLFQLYCERGLLDVDVFRISYRFVDPLLSHLFGLCRDWNERWADLSDVILQYRYVPAIKLGKLESAIYYKRLHNQYFTLDARWLREVCRSLLYRQGPETDELARITASIGAEMEALRRQLDQHATSRQYQYDLYGGFAEP